MADTTLSSTLISTVSARNIATGVYALYASYTATATPSASQVFLMLPLHQDVTVLDGWVRATFAGGSFSMKLMVGTIDNHSFFLSNTEVFTNRPQRFQNNIPHLVTLTDSDSFPLMKPLCVTIGTAASGTIVTTPVYTVMALLQNS